MDKTLMLNMLQKHYNFEKDSQFAQFLGISPQMLSNWKTRNTFDVDILYTKCVGVSPKWLLSFDGDMFQKENKGYNVLRESESEYGDSNISRIKELLDIIKDKNRIIELLEAENKSLKTDASRPHHTKRAAHVQQ